MAEAKGGEGTGVAPSLPFVSWDEALERLSQELVTFADVTQRAPVEPTLIGRWAQGFGGSKTPLICSTVGLEKFKPQ